MGFVIDHVQVKRVLIVIMRHTVRHSSSPLLDLAKKLCQMQELYFCSHLSCSMISHASKDALSHVMCVKSLMHCYAHCHCLFVWQIQIYALHAKRFARLKMPLKELKNRSASPLLLTTSSLSSV